MENYDGYLKNENDFKKYRLLNGMVGKNENDFKKYRLLNGMVGKN